LFSFDLSHSKCQETREIVVVSGASGVEHLNYVTKHRVGKGVKMKQSHAMETYRVQEFVSSFCFIVFSVWVTRIAVWILIVPCMSSDRII
jgi:hypothetical protein